MPRRPGVMNPARNTIMHIIVMLKRSFLSVFLLLAVATTGLQAAEIKPGDSLPNCQLAPLGGGAGKDLRQYQGKVVYVDFWASWCGPCAQSFPFMNKLHRDLHGKGLEILGVNLDEEPEDAMGFLTRTPAQFTILADASGQCPQAFGVRAMPSSYLVDRKGVVRYVHLGFKPGEAEQFRQQVEALLETSTN